MSDSTQTPARGGGIAPPLQARLAGAPISWGVCEVPGWGRQLPPDRVLGEMASLGLRATELGAAGYLPGDAGALRALLDRHGLALVGGFVPLVLHERSLEAALAAAEAAAATLAAAGGTIFLAAIVMDAQWSRPVPLDDAQWSRLAAHLEEIEALVAAHGLTLAVHPHWDTLVESAADVERLLDAAPGVPWCLDTGHLALGGLDPAAFAAADGKRIAHVHLKDVDEAVAARLRAGELTLMEAAQAGLFRPLGQGSAGIADVMRHLDRRGYEGWLVLEQDAAITGDEPPAGSGPVDDVRASIEFLETLAPAKEPARARGRQARERIGVGVIGFGWLGQAHSRSMRRIPTLFADRDFDPVLVACADPAPGRAEQAVDSFGFESAGGDWRRVIDDPAVDVVVIAAPNMLHVELVEAAAAAGKHVFCEKPVGGTPAQTVRAERAARRAGVTSGVGYNYRWAPLVRYTAELISSGELGEITNYRGRFFSMYGADPLGLLSWRFRVEEGGHGVTSDLLSHAVDLGHMLLGPITRVVGTTETFIRDRPLPGGDGTGHYGRGAAGDRTGPVTNEDYAAVLCEFAGGARGTFEASRTIVGPESQMAFDVYGTSGAAGWNLEKLNELQLYRSSDDRGSGYTTVFGGDRFPYHGAFVPGSANGIGFEDLVVIEDFEFCRAVAAGRPFAPGFAEAVEWVSVQAALLRSVQTGGWEPVVSLREE